MIESVEKQKRVLAKLERWVEQRKVVGNLIAIRDNELHQLAHSITDEFYNIQLCCGHMVRGFDEGEDLVFSEHDGSKIYGTYCKDCAKVYKRELNATSPHVC